VGILIEWWLVWLVGAMLRGMVAMEERGVHCDGVSVVRRRLHGGWLGWRLWFLSLMFVDCRFALALCWSACVGVFGVFVFVFIEASHTRNETFEISNFKVTAAAGESEFEICRI